jgi:flagellar hook-length control protein FliK
VPSVASETSSVIAHHARSHARPDSKRAVSTNGGPPFGDLFEAAPERAEPPCSDVARADATPRPNAAPPPSRPRSVDQDTRNAPADAAPADTDKPANGNTETDTADPTLSEIAIRPYVTELAEDLAPKTTESDVTPEPVDTAPPVAPDIALVLVAPTPVLPAAPAADDGAASDSTVSPPAAVAPSPTPTAPIDSALSEAGPEATEGQSTAQSEPVAAPAQSAAAPEPDHQPEPAPAEARTSETAEKPKGESRAPLSALDLVAARDADSNDDPADNTASIIAPAAEKVDPRPKSSSPGVLRHEQAPSVHNPAPNRSTANEAAEPQQTSASHGNHPHANAAHPTPAPQQPNIEQAPDLGRAPAEQASSAAPAIANTEATPPTINANVPLGVATATPNVQQAAPAAAAIPIAGIAVEIATRAQAGQRQFDIRLDPPELGRIDVRLDVDTRGNVTSRLVVERAETLDLLRREAPQLERALQDAGLKSGDNAMQFSLRHQGGGTNGQNDSNGALRNAVRLVVEDESVSADMARNYLRLLGRPGGVDIRV